MYAAFSDIVVEEDNENDQDDYEPNVGSSPGVKRRGPSVQCRGEKRQRPTLDRQSLEEHMQEIEDNIAVTLGSKELRAAELKGTKCNNEEQMNSSSEKKVSITELILIFYDYHVNAIDRDRVN